MIDTSIILIIKKIKPNNFQSIELIFLIFNVITKKLFFFIKNLVFLIQCFNLQQVFKTQAEIA
ncbi:MAG: hypothetical protein EAZ06_12025 [Cytophagales bacterium]|nr:MAG: hypothetical protein EAZ06_12025 [Cytophagales bacterium]